MAVITVNGHSLDWQPGLTVRKMLQLMNYSFPMVVIKVNGKLVPKAEYDSYNVPEEAEVFVIHLMSGG